MNRLPLTPKIGEIPSNQEKFAGWSSSCGYYPRAATANNPFKTDKMMNSSFNLDDLILNRTICSQLCNRNKNLVEFKRPLTDSEKQQLEGLSPHEVKFSPMRKSNAYETYVYYHQNQILFQEHGDVLHFQRSFMKYQKLGSDGISFYEIDLVVKDCLGQDTAEFIISKFKEFGGSYAIRGEIFWDDFCKIIEKVRSSIDAECAVHKEAPPLVALMNRPRLADKNLEALGDLSTIYRDNFNHTPEIEFREDGTKFHYRKPMEEIDKSYNNASKTLYAGTTKVTYHVPGYCGHIPENLRNEKKFVQATGKVPHPVVNNLRLTQRGMGCLVGYTGYVPMEPIGSHHERMTSCDLRTSNGAAFSGTRALL